MATGKERGYKDWKLGKNIKRSARNYTESSAPRGGGGGKKNTKKWCKGKVGRKHTMVLYNKYSGLFYHKCIVCGKELYGKLDAKDFDFVSGNWEMLYRK